MQLATRIVTNCIVKSIVRYSNQSISFSHYGVVIDPAPVLKLSEILSPAATVALL